MNSASVSIVTSSQLTFFSCAFILIICVLKVKSSLKVKVKHKTFMLFKDELNESLLHSCFYRYSFSLESLL